MSNPDRADTELYDGDAACADARDQLDAAEERLVRRRRGDGRADVPSMGIGPPVRRLGIETIAVGSTAALSERGRLQFRPRGAGVVSTRSTWAGYRPATAVPSPPEPEPHFYELEAEEYLQTLIQCEEDVEDFRSEAAEKNRQL